MTPLLLFCYNRPDYLRRVVTAILNQTVAPSMVLAFRDGPPSILTEQCESILMHNLPPDRLEIIRRTPNWGCAKNIMLGIREVAEHYDDFVVLEDDTLPAPCWYEAMVSMLQRYEAYDAVGAVGSFPSVLNGSLPDFRYDVLLSPRFSCWGWGSWSAKWATIDKEWQYYRDNNGQPPWNPDKLPNYAGYDIGPMIRNHAKGELWDGVVAGSFLHHDLLHAITRHYLVNNIGAEIPIGKLEFMLANNRIVDRLPATFPSVISLVPEVAAAVRAYVAAMS